MAGKIFRLSLVKGGGKYYPPLFTLLTHAELGISKSYYNKIRNKLRQGDELPQSIINRLEKVKFKNKHTIELFDNTPVNVSIPASITTPIKKYKTKKYVWVKFTLSTQGNLYYQSFTLPIKNISKINKQLKDYIEANIKRYSDYPVYIHQITLQAI